RFGAGGADTRRNQRERLAERRAKLGRLLRRTHDAVEAAVAREAGEPQRLARRRVRDAGLGEGLRVEARQHRHRDEERPGKAFGSGSGSDGFAGGDEHRPAAGRVNVEHPYTEARRRGAGAGDGVRNIVELEVEEEAEAASDELAHDLRARSNDELLADLDRAAARVEP